MNNVIAYIGKRNPPGTGFLTGGRPSSLPLYILLFGIKVPYSKTNAVSPLSKCIPVVEVHQHMSDSTN